MTAFAPSEVDDYLLKNVPPELLKAIRRDGHKRSTSLNNIMGEVMSARYGLPWESSDRDPRATSSKDMYLRLPAAVMDAVRSEAWVREVTMRTVFLDALAEHYDHPTPERKKTTGAGRPRGRKGKP